MKSKYLFWILLALLVATLALIYFLRVKETAAKLQEHVALLDTLTQSARSKAPAAVGREQLATMIEMQKKVKTDVLERLHASFARRDSDNLDMWFFDLKTPWKTWPKVEDFQRQYDLAVDRLIREARAYLGEQGVRNVSPQLISHEPLTRMPKETAEQRRKLKAEMRRRQKEFWVQDRLVRLFARVGAWLSQPIKGGESMGVAAAGTSGAAFERIRYEVRVQVKGDRILDALHALDGPVTLHGEDGGLLVVALSAIIDNIAIRNLDLTYELTNTWMDEPPVEVVFHLTVLDYIRPQRRKDAP